MDSLQRPRVADRVASLDAFRGIAVALMILVNNPGNWSQVFRPLAHAPWNGWTLADLVFPAFLFIMGVAIPLSIAGREQTQAARAHAHARLVLRSLTLIGLGVFLNVLSAWPELSALRIPGVLQRIGVTYLAAGFVVLHTPPRRWLPIAAALLLLHWGILMLPFGGHPAGTLLPTHNTAAFVDDFVFGEHVLNQNGDPEGLVGVISSVATTLLGAIAGYWLRVAAPERRVGGLLAGGAVAVVVGCLWSFVLPFNKTLWTGSYALFAAGMAALAFAVCYWLIDTVHLDRWARPFVWLGVNPLAVYFLSELVGRLIERPLIPHGHRTAAIKELIFWGQLVPLFHDAGGVWSSLTFGVLYATLWIGVACLLSWRGIRIRT